MYTNRPPPKLSTYNRTEMANRKDYSKFVNL